MQMHSHRALNFPMSPSHTLPLTSLSFSLVLTHMHTQQRRMHLTPSEISEAFCQLSSLHFAGAHVLPMGKAATQSAVLLYVEQSGSSRNALNLPVSGFFSPFVSNIFFFCFYIQLMDFFRNMKVRKQNVCYIVILLTEKKRISLIY